MLKRIALSISLAVFGMAIVAPTPAQAATGWWLEYRNVSSGKCIDVKDSSTGNGAMIQEYPCKSITSSGAENQEWQMQASGTHGQFVNEHSFKCMELINGSLADGATVWQWACTGATKQQWDMIFVQEYHNGTESWLIKSSLSGKCLTRANSGTSLYVSTCSSTNTSQVWHDNLGTSGCTTCKSVATREDV